MNSAWKPRVNLNQQDMKKLHEQLKAVMSEEWANFIVAYKQNGPFNGTIPTTPGPSGTLDLSKPGNTKLVQVLDLIGKQTQVTYQGNTEPTVLVSPFAADIVRWGSTCRRSWTTAP